MSNLSAGKYPSPLLEQDFINSACWKFAEYVDENYPEIVKEFNEELKQKG